VNRCGNGTSRITQRFYFDGTKSSSRPLNTRAVLGLAAAWPLQSCFFSPMRVFQRLECGKTPPSCPGVGQALYESERFHVAAGCRISLCAYGCWWNVAVEEFTGCGSQSRIPARLSSNPYSACSGIRPYDEPRRYDVIDRIGDRVEIRRYVSRLSAEVGLTSAGDTGRREAFQLLFAYIAGANRASMIGQGHRHDHARRDERKGIGGHDRSGGNLG